MHPTPTDPVEAVGELEITISVRRPASRPATSTAAGSSSAGSEAAHGGDHPGGTSGSIGASGWTPEAVPRVFSEALEREALAAESPADFAALRLNHLRPDHRLQANSGPWTPAARLGRAFKAGVVARSRLDNRHIFEESPSVPYRNQYYVVLRGAFGNQSCWTTSYTTYCDRVIASRAGIRGFAPESVSHAFASQSECAAYLSGARVAWPPEASQ